MIKTGFPFLLLLFGVHLAQAQPDSLVTAAWKGNLNQVARFVSEGTELDKPNAYGLTPWQAAQLTGRRKMLDWMAGQEPDTLQSLPERSALAYWFFSPLKEEGLPGAAALVGRGETVVWIGEPIDEFRIQPDNTPGTFRIEAITLLIPETGATPAE